VPTFSYRARDDNGRVVSRTVEASSKDALISELKQQGLKRIKVQEKRVGQAGKRRVRNITIFSGRVKLRDLSIFYRQFATMINAGVSLIRCLDVLEQQTSSARLKEIIRDIESEIEGGATLSRSMSKYPRDFSSLAVGLVRAGEVGGVLDITLSRLAAFTEKDMDLRRKVKSSMTYPVLVMFVAVAITTALMTFIVPKFISLFADLGMKEEDFPTPTLLLKRTSDFMIQKWYILLGGLIAFIIIFGRIKATKTGKRLYDRAALKVPVFGSLNHKVSVARFSRTLSTLLASGVPILQAMETVAGTIGNDIIADAIMASRASIREGETIAGPLAASRMFPPMVVQMISIGEETGQLDSMLEKIADFYESEVDAALESLTAALEPVMIIVLGVIVGFIVISMWLPMITAIQKLSG